MKIILVNLFICSPYCVADSVQISDICIFSDFSGMFHNPLIYESYLNLASDFWVVPFSFFSKGPVLWLFTAHMGFQDYTPLY